MKLEERIILFSKLGQHFSQVLETEEFEDLLQNAKNRNAWFTIDNLKKAIRNISETFLNEKRNQSIHCRIPSGLF